MTTAVVILMPPAVEPEPPPININSMFKSFEAPLIPARSMVLNPAVLGVTDAKTAPSTFSFTVIPAKSPLFSKMPNNSAPPNTRIADAVSTILVCRE